MIGVDIHSLLRDLSNSVLNVSIKISNDQVYTLACTLKQELVPCPEAFLQKVLDHNNANMESEILVWRTDTPSWAAVHVPSILYVQETTT